MMKKIVMILSCLILGLATLTYADERIELIRIESIDNPTEEVFGGIIANRANNDRMAITCVKNDNFGNCEKFRFIFYKTKNLPEEIIRPIIIGKRDLTDDDLATLAEVLRETNSFKLFTVTQKYADFVFQTESGQILTICTLLIGTYAVFPVTFTLDLISSPIRAIGSARTGHKLSKAMYHLLKRADVSEIEKMSNTRFNLLKNAIEKF